MFSGLQSWYREGSRLTSDTGQNEEFVEAALEYPQITVFAAELVRNLPAFLCP